MSSCLLRFQIVHFSHQDISCELLPRSVNKQQLAMSSDLSDIFFTGSQNPRHGCVMIGYVAQRPVYFEFDTPEIATSETRTTVSSVAALLLVLLLCLGPNLSPFPQDLPQRQTRRRIL